MAVRLKAVVSKLVAIHLKYHEDSRRRCLPTQVPREITSGPAAGWSIRGRRQGRKPGGYVHYTYCRPGSMKFEVISVVEATADAECVKALLQAKDAQAAARVAMAHGVVPLSGGAVPAAAAEVAIGPMVVAAPLPMGRAALKRPRPGDPGTP